MSIKTRLVCDACPAEFVAVGSARETRVLRELAALQGWKHRPDQKEDFCPECLTRGKDKKRSRATVR